MDELAKSRLKLTVAVGCAVALLAMPTVLFEPVLEWEDFIFGQFWLPIGALMICIFVTRKCGWGYDAFSVEASHGEGMRFPSVFAPIMKWIVPLLIILTMVAGLFSR
jgi:NSS family neurotransmitter:Na+ symporter